MRLRYIMCFTKKYAELLVKMLFMQLLIIILVKQHFKLSGYHCKAQTTRAKISPNRYDIVLHMKLD
jgi:hypothetical protein